MEQNGAYLRFLAMIATSAVAMFILEYATSLHSMEHAWFSEMRLLMTLTMAASMSIIMLAFMPGMYPNRKANAAIYAGSTLALVAGLWLTRSQMTMSGTDYMKDMIPHQSASILTSERAGIEDPRVRELADQIKRSRKLEIRQMDWLIRDIRKNGIARTDQEAKTRPVPVFDQ